ncbi:SH3 domain-containing protein [Synechococcus sp. R55.3]|uniref:SH3 domain-containing protein n=1 Tax=Synechococcus sp. R55.3 TaxID=2969647 RepID=UPI0039C04EF7
MTVRVPLDYYRVLMLSARADEHQIEQAYRERIDLKPGERSWLLEFSPQAVEARAQMIQEAASVLLNPEARRNYDEHLMPADPTLTVEEAHLPGVLCLYCEAGEYQAALDLAQHMLEQGHPARSDAILARAIARLELGREAWQQGSYEEAARSLQAGLAELEEYQAFPQMQAEIRIDLGKLRPYRILQLLSHEAHAPAPAGRETLVLRTADANGERQQGLALLKAMLDERGGIEGVGQDGSGLSTEDFLRFIQRVRRHLTLKEQQELFEQEAERPSMVAAYLAVQVLLAAGYLENRPALVRRARGYLARLAQRQDVHLEQAICSLLLGQTEEALAHLRSTQEVEALQFIEEHSAGSPDHLPGLCRFTEKWFQEEVFPEFRGLEATQATLQAYFDNPQVQAYLDEMPSREDPPAGMLSPKVPHPPPHLPAVVGGVRPPNPTQELQRPPTPWQRGGVMPPPEPPRLSDLPSYRSTPKAGVSALADESSSAQDRSPQGDGVQGLRSAGAIGLQDVERYRRSRLGGRKRPTFPAGVRLGSAPLARMAGVVGVGILSLLVIWQMLRGLFTPPPAPPLEQPQVQIEQPPVDISPRDASANDNPGQTEPAPPPELTGPLAEWQGVQQVRVVSNDGLNIRQQPSLTGAIVGTAPRQALLRVVEVQAGEGQVPVWLRIERDGAPGGWVAAQSGSTRLVERL